MKRNRLAMGLGVLAAAFGLNACYNEPEFGTTPNLIFRGLEQTTYRNAQNINVDTLVLVVRFQDGDGDLGLDPGDNKPPFSTGDEYFFNIFVNAYKKQNGEFKPLMLAGRPLDFNGRFPRVSLDARKEPLEGDIRYKIPVFDQPRNPDFPLKKGDTIRFDVQIVDRAFNKSPLVTTSEVIVFSGK